MSRLSPKYGGSWRWAQIAWARFSGAWEACVTWVRTGGVWKISQGETRIPVTSILLFVGTTVPMGFTRYAAADGKFIVGAGSGYTAATDYGATTTTISGTLPSTGSHNGGTTFTAGNGGSAACANGTAGSHGHTYSKSVTTVDEYQDYILIQADWNHATIPENAVVLSAQTLAGLTNLETTVDRFVRGAATYGGTGGTATPNDSVVSSSNGAHRHGWDACTFISGDPSYSDPVNIPLSSGAHTHTVTIDVALNTKRRYLSAWGPGSAAKGFVEKNVIILWPSASPPEGYYVCDGTNGTPDMRDYHLRIGNTANHGTAAGDNSATVTLSTSTDGNHHHKGGTDYNSLGSLPTCYHANTKNAHTHSDTYSQTVAQYAHALTFIMKA